MGYKTAPEAVRQAFDELKRTLNKPLSLHRISGSYYVYEYMSAKSAKSSKTVIKTFYIGHITVHGKFVAKGQKDLAGLEVKEAVATQQAGEPYDEREAIVLRNLSMNGRMSMAKLAKRLQMSTTGARHFVKRLEEKYNMKYFAEVNTLKLGYLGYIALVKFENKVPPFEVIKEAFETDPHVVLAAMTKGIYDMIIMFYIENTESPTLFLYNWRRSRALPNYAAKWYVAPLGKSPEVTLPLRPQVIEWITTNLIKESEVKSRTVNKLTRIEGLTLKELVLDGNQNFKNLDKKYELSQGRSNYAFYKLKEKGVIERITITISPPNLRYNAIFITETNHYKKFIEVQHQYRLDLINQENPIVNKNVYRGDIGMPDSILHIRPIFWESEFQKARGELDSIAGTKTDSLIITDIVVGYLCYRNFDFTYSPIYTDLLKQGKVPDLKKTDY